jgi:hypothetical protein
MMGWFQTVFTNRKRDELMKELTIIDLKVDARELQAMVDDTDAMECIGWCSSKCGRRDGGGYTGICGDE